MTSGPFRRDASSRRDRCVVGNFVWYPRSPGVLYEDRRGTAGKNRYGPVFQLKYVTLVR